jgi:hypothetical protein
MRPFVVGVLILLRDLERRIKASRICPRQLRGGGFALLESGIVALDDMLIIRARCHLMKRCLIEDHRGFLEVVEGKNDCANEQDEHLQPNLGDSVEEQAQSAIPEGSACEIPLDLTLIASEIGERKEHSTQEPAPDICTGRSS